ncbi:MAG: CHAT domain-containing protein [Balneolaceae bacterium]|nr:MAG: CHAT domain-containing protein [Balneolaceae bacterium]
MMRGTLSNLLKGIFCFLALTFLCTEYGISQHGSTLSETFREAEELFIYNDSEQSEKLFKSIEEDLCNNEDYYELCVDSFIYRASILRNSREYEAADHLLDDAKNLAYNLLGEGHPLLVKIFAQKAFLNEDLANIDEARIWADRAIEVVNEYSPGEISFARAGIIDGYILNSQGNYSDALEAYSSVLNILNDLEKDLEVMRLLSQLHNNIGVVYRRLGQLEEALEHYLSAREVIIKALGESHHEMALIYNNVGGIYYVLGDRGRAAEYFIRSADILIENFGQMNDNVSRAYNNAGVVYLQLGDLEKAIHYLELAQRVKEEIHGSEHPNTAVGYNNLGSVYLQKEEFERAEKNYRLAIEVRKNIHGDNHPNLIAPLHTLSGLYIQTERWGDARKELQRALNIGLSRFNENHIDMIDTYSLIANSYLMEGDYNNAHHYYSKTLSLILGVDVSDEAIIPDLSQVSYTLKLIENIRGMNRVLHEKFKASGDKQLLHESLRFTTIASETIDMLQTSFQNEASKLNLIDNNYEIYSNALDIIFKLYTISHDDNWLDEMHYYSEKSRSRIAHDLLQSVEARNFGGVPDEVINVERELNTKVSDYYQKLQLEQEKGEEGSQSMLRQYRDSLFYAKRELHQFTQSLEENYPDYYQLKYDRKLAARDDIQSMIGPDETVLSYSFGSESLYAIIIDSEQISVRKLEKDEGLADQIEKIRKSVISGRTTEYEEAAYHLYTQLIEPVKDLLRTESVIILPDQAMHYLPFEMLLTEKPNGKMYHHMPFLLRQYQIQYRPSATVMITKQQQRPQEPKNLLALAPFSQSTIPLEQDELNERYFDQLTPLPLSGYEAQEIAKLFRVRNSLWSFFFPEHAEVLTDRRASKSRILNGALDDYGFIHFATHAFVNERNPALSGIALHGGDDGDGIVYVGEIYNLQMRADLVVLGACDTGLGEIRRGEGLIGFTRAFLYAGASNLVVSMWKVNDQPTAHLMIGFYEHIREGQSYGSALRNAKISLMDHPEYAAPRNWAAFILNGR